MSFSCTVIRCTYIVFIWVTGTNLFAAEQLRNANHSDLDIQSLISSANPHDTIVIPEGTYLTESITITKPVTLLGVNKPELKSKSGDELLVVISDSVKIIGLTFSDVTTSFIKERAAIRMVKAEHFLIENNIIDQCFFGIYLEHSKSGRVANNIVSGSATTEAGSGNAIHAWYSSDLDIEGNELNGHRDGIYFEFVSDSKILRNRSTDNLRYGLHFMFSNDDIYTANFFENNGSGVAVMFSKNIDMLENTFSRNWGSSSYGLLLKEINDAKIIGNDFVQNTIGVFVEGSNRITYSGNSFIRNGWAIKFSGGCSANEITRNNFLHNSLDLLVGAKLANNQLHHNYWSNYNGYDLDKDNMGDVPYYPVKLFSYVLEQVPEAIVLMRSFFVEIINFSERVSPVFTPKEVKDDFPLMNKNHYDPVY